jgi:glucosamine 6-phosphate synthetase-like amidotransferase/phosphosugar isomerase protein
MLKLFESIKTKDGVDNYIAEGLQEIEGAYAVMIHDTEIPNRIQFFRNKERPLFYGGIDDDNIYFSSLEEGLLAIGVPEERIIEVQPDVIYTANIENNTVVITEEAWVKIKKELPKPNFQMAPHNPQQKNEKVTLWGQSSTNTSRNDIMESMKEVFSRSQKNKKSELRENTTEKTTTDEIIKIGTKVEVLDSVGMTLYGTVVSILHPTYIVSVIEKGKSRLEFCHRDVMIEMGEQVVEHIPSVSLASIDIGKKTRL